MGVLDKKIMSQQIKVLKEKQERKHSRSYNFSPPTPVVNNKVVEFPAPVPKKTNVNRANLVQSHKTISQAPCGNCGRKK